MPILNHNLLEEAINCLKKGLIIAYPTEAVYGLGCDPFNQGAIEHLLKIKGRDHAHGFIVVAKDWEQVQSLIQPVDEALLKPVLASWPGPFTWIFPAQPGVPAWLMGKHHSLAVRVSDHPIIRELCTSFGGPIVSTSANYHGEPPARCAKTVKGLFGDQVALVIEGALGSLIKPTSIRDVLTQKIVRE